MFATRPCEPPTKRAVAFVDVDAVELLGVRVDTLVTAGDSTVSRASARRSGTPGQVGHMCAVHPFTLAPCPSP